MTRLQDAQAEFDRWREYHAQRDPDLFDRSTWEQPASASKTWQAEALEVVRQAALGRSSFTVEDLEFPSTPDRRAVGMVLRRAARIGYVRADGYVTGGPARHGRPVMRWVSLIERQRVRDRAGDGFDG